MEVKEEDKFPEPPESPEARKESPLKESNSPENKKATTEVVHLEEIKPAEKPGTVPEEKKPEVKVNVEKKPEIKQEKATEKEEEKDKEKQARQAEMSAK